MSGDGQPETQRPEPALGELARRRLWTLSDLSRLGLVTAIGTSLFFSLAAMAQVGVNEGLLCLLATAALIAVSLPLAVDRRGDLFEPIWFVLIIVAIGVTGKAFYLVFGPQQRVDFLLLGKEPADLLFAALVMATSLLCLAVGYVFGNVRWKLPMTAGMAADRWNTGRLAITVGALTLMGLVAFALFVIRMNISFDDLSTFSSKRFERLPGSKYLGVQGYLRWGVMQIELAFYLYYVWWAGTKKKSLWSLSGAVVILFALLSMIFPVFVSSRQTVMFLIIRIVVLWLCLRGEPKPRYVIALAAVGLVLIGSMLAFRRGLSDLESIGEHAGVSGLLEVTVGGRHFLDLTKTAHVLDGFPEVLDYQFGKSMVTWLVAPIPRGLWPDKPAIGVGIDIGPVLFDTPTTSGVPPGIVAELYLNFGLLGVYVGMLVVGFLLRSLYVTFRPHFPNKALVLIYTLLASRIVLGMLPGAVSGSATKIIQEMIVLLPLLYFITGARAESSSPTLSHADAAARI